MVLGPDAVMEFREKWSSRKSHISFSYFQCELGKTNEAVNDWLSMLEKKSPRTCKMLLKLPRRMLIIDKDKRPNAKQVTARLQFIAYCEVVDAVDGLFLRVLKLSDSLYARMEQQRFESWKYAMGMLDQNIAPYLLDKEDHAMNQTAEFDSLLDCLFHIRECLHSISTQKENLDQSIFLVLGSLDNRLSKLMGKTLQDKYRKYLEASVVKSGSISNDESATETSIFSIQSVASSAFTGNSVLTYTEMNRATEELVSIFLDDQEMEALYRVALHNERIGPERFTRNFKRLLVIFS